MNFVSFLPLLIELLVKSAAILLAATFADRTWRRASAAQRHAIWLAAFAALLFLPATRLIAPRWNLARSQPAMVHVRFTSAAASAPASASESAAAPVEVASAPTPSPWVSWVPWDLCVSWLSRLDWPAVATCFWLAGAVTLLGRRVLGTVRLGAMRRASTPASDAQFAHARRVAAEFGVTRPVDVRVSRLCRVPLTWGTWMPVLMLPEDCAAWPDDRLLAAMRHELAHIRRGDFAVRLLADVVRAFYWPNPLMWLASRALRTAQEQACDDLVLKAGTCPTDYATLLCEAARRFTAPHGAVAMAQPSTLESRVRAIVDATRNRRPLTWPTTLLGALLIALALAASTAAQLHAAEPAPVATEAAAPAEAAAVPAPGDAATPDKTPQIKIEAKIVEIAPDVSIERLLSFPGIPASPSDKSPPSAINLPDGTFNVPANLNPPSVMGILSDPAYQAIGRKLETSKGVRILGIPRVITPSRQNATFAIGQEVRYATAWEKGAAREAWKPTAFAKKNCGPTLEILPEIGPDGETLDLTMRSQVIELLGFTDPETGKPVPAGKDGPEAEGPRRKAVFSTPKTGGPTTTVSIFDGQTVLLELARTPEGKPSAGKTPQGRILAFVTASMVLPNGEKAPPLAAQPARKPGPPQIAIEAKFIQITLGKTKANAPIEKSNPTSAEGISAKRIDALLFGNNGASFPVGTVSVGSLGAPFQNFVADALKKKNGVDVIAMPRVTTKTGQRAVIEIIRERRYATEWKEGAKRGAWKPTAFATKNIGTTLEVEPTVQADGTIALNLVPEVVDFLGFENLDTGKPMPPGTDDSVPQVWSTSTTSPPLSRPGADAAAPEGPRLQAVFSTFKLKTRLVLKPGETVMLDPLGQTEDVKPFADRVRKGNLTVFITASIVDPAGNPLPAAK